MKTSYALSGPRDAVSIESLLISARDGGAIEKAVLTIALFNMLVQWAKLRGIDEHQAEDVAQDSIINILLSLDSFEPINPSGWVYKILLNQIRTYFRKSGREIYCDVLPFEPVVESHEDSRDAAETVQRLCMHLSQVENEVLRLYYWKGFRLREIAEKLQLPLGTIGNILTRARKKMLAEYKRIASRSESTRFTGVN